MNPEYTGAIGGAAQGAAIGAQVGGVPGAIVGGVIGGVTGFLGGSSDKKAARKAKRLARAQAAELRRQAVENQRVAENVAAREVSQAKVTSYASNLMDTGTTRQYRRAMEHEYRRQINYDYIVAMKNARSVEETGQYLADSIKRQGFGAAVDQVFSAATQFAGQWAPEKQKTNTPVVSTTQNSTKGGLYSSGVGK